ALDSPNSSAALPACGFVSFIWPSSAPTISMGENPPISPQMCFHVQPFARLMSRIFSVTSARCMGFLLLDEIKPSARRRLGGIARSCGRRGERRLRQPGPHHRHLARIAARTLALGKAAAAGHRDIVGLVRDWVVRAAGGYG